MPEFLMIAVVCQAALTVVECGPERGVVVPGPSYESAELCKDHAEHFERDAVVRSHAFRLVKSRRGQLKILCVKKEPLIG